MRLTMPWNATETHHNGNGALGKLDELRAALGKEVDHLAKVAAQLSHEIGNKATEAGGDATDQVATATRETRANATGIARQIMAGAAALGPTIAFMSRKRAESLGHDAQSFGQDLRRVRLTTEPRRTAPDIMPGVALLGGFGAGIALMYFLDPERGRRRRALLRDQVNKWTRIGRDAASGKAKDLRNRAEGAVIEARKAVVSIEPEVSELDTATYEAYAYGSTQTPEAPEDAGPSPENAEQETRATVG